MQLELPLKEYRVLEHGNHPGDDVLLYVGCIAIRSLGGRDLGDKRHVAFPNPLTPVGIVLIGGIRWIDPVAVQGGGRRFDPHFGAGQTERAGAARVAAGGERYGATQKGGRV